MSQPRGCCSIGKLGRGLAPFSVGVGRWLRSPPMPQASRGLLRALTTIGRGWEEAYPVAGRIGMARLKFIDEVAERGVCGGGSWQSGVHVDSCGTVGVTSLLWGRHGDDQGR